MAAALVETPAELLRIEDSFFGSSTFAAALWIDTATVLVDKGLIMIIMMMASNKGGSYNEHRKKAAQNLPHTTLLENHHPISLKAIQLFGYLGIYLIFSLDGSQMF